MLKDQLTPREYEAATHIAKGYTEMQAAKAMGLTRNSMSQMLTRVYYKLRIPHRSSINPAVALAALYIKEHPTESTWVDEIGYSNERTKPRLSAPRRRINDVA